MVYNRCRSCLSGHMVGCIHEAAHVGLHMGSSDNTPVWWDDGGTVYTRCPAVYAGALHCNRPHAHYGWHTLEGSDFAWTTEPTTGMVQTTGQRPVARSPLTVPLSLGPATIAEEARQAIEPASTLRGPRTRAERKGKRHGAS